MIEPKLKELINRDIDGQLAADEQIRLGKALRRNAGARKLHRELQGLNMTLASLQHAEPPVHLANRIRAAVHANDTHPSPVKHTWRDSLTSILRPPVVVRYAYVFAGGLLAGILLFFVTSDGSFPGSVSDAELTGTLVLEGPVPGFTSGGVRTVNSGMVKGSIETQFRTGLCLLRLNLDSPEPLTAYILTDPSNVQVEAVRPSNNSEEQLTVRDGEVALGAPKTGGMVVLFAGKTEHLPPARLKLLSSGRLVYDGIVPLEKGN